MSTDPYESEKCRKAFAEGKKIGLKGGGDIELFVDGMVPSTKENQSRMAGIREGQKEIWSGRSSSGSETSSSDQSSNSYSHASYGGDEDGGGVGGEWAVPGWLLWVILIVVFYLIVWTFSALEYGQSPFPLPWVPWLRDLLKH